MPKTQRARTFPALGQFLRRVRENRGLLAKDVAARAHMRPAQVTHLQQGGNAMWEYYDDFARALGFKGALEMFQSGGDTQLGRLIRVWRALPDDGARTAALRAVKQILDADEESSATGSPTRTA